MRVAAFQFDVRRREPEANLSAALEGLRRAAEEGVELVLLPELWPSSFVPVGTEGDWLGASEDAHGALVEEARALGVAVAGSTYARATEDLPRNRFTLFDGGDCVLSYDKVHLFSPTGEGLGFSAGDQPPPTATWRGLRVTGVVCYDLRFASLLRAPLLAEAELLLVSAQWPVGRISHWRALLAGRAVEHQAFVLGANRIGNEAMGRRAACLEFPGSSALVAPDGRIVVEGVCAQGLVSGPVEIGEVRRLRREVPVRRDERVLPG